MENRNSIAGTVPVLGNQYKSSLSNSSERPLSFSEGFDNGSIDLNNVFIPTSSKNASDNNNVIISSTTPASTTATTTTSTVAKSKLSLVSKNKKSSLEQMTLTNPNANVTMKNNKQMMKSNKKNIKSISDDDDGDADLNSLASQESRMSMPQQQSTANNTTAVSTLNNNTSLSNPPNSKPGGDWEILEGLKSGQSFNQIPVRYSGFMMKNRKWPMKGWHKRFFLLENGYLTYAKSISDIERGKYHGQVDVGLSVIVCKVRGHRIDMDADDTIYHLKTKTLKEFEEWKSHLRDHRLYRQNAISVGCGAPRDINDMLTGAYASSMSSPGSACPDVADGESNSVFLKLTSDVEPIINPTVVVNNTSTTSATSTSASTTLSTSASTTATTTSADPSLDPPQVQKPNYTAPNPNNASNLVDQKVVLLNSEELNEVQLKLFDLASLLTGIQDAYIQFTTNQPTTSSTIKKDKVKKHYIGRNKKEKRLKELLTVPDTMMPLVKCSSNPSLANDEELLSSASTTATNATNTALTTTTTTTTTSAGNNNNKFSILHDQFYRQAEFIHCRLKKICNQMLAAERSRVTSEIRNSMGFSPSYVQSLKHIIAELKKQNEDFRNKLSHIHRESSIVDPMLGYNNIHLHNIITPTPSIHHDSKTITDFNSLTERLPFTRGPLVSSESLDSQNNEFYDAPDQLDHSTDGTEEEEEEDEVSDSEIKTNLSQPDMEERFSRFQMRRRSRLPSPSVESDVSIWGLLRKNIGKDLSKISMPVGMNEPLNALQRLCEELEYTELLDRAVEIDDPFERMVWVAVFTVSSYSSTFTRAGYKPFNPLLGETFEMDRSEKGWRFVAEQVSHHPPVSACHCESKDFVLWQDMQVKTKFWGKSMEVQPIGLVNLKIHKHKEDYTWNKATSCIHNILGGQRWVEHYGEVIITNHTRGIVCKLNYVKSSYFSAKKYEVYGQVCSLGSTLPIHHLFGRWNEHMFHGQSESSAKCIWRPGALPPDHHLYYGFTKFAMELNEIDPDQMKLYPVTDTRFRPDQRLLECGKIDEAEAEKRRVEQGQREMRKSPEFNEDNYHPRWFFRKTDANGRESYEYNGQYWSKRKSGFNNIDLPTLW